jgi:hypothetical protein
VPVIPVTQEAEAGGSSKASSGKSRKPYLKNKLKAGGVPQVVVKHLTSRCGALGSIPNTAERESRGERERKRERERERERDKLRQE